MFHVESDSMKKQTGKTAKQRRLDWGPEEVPYCESTIELPRKIGDPFIIRFSPRGLRELRRREKNEREKERYYELDRKRHPERYGIPVEWILGDPCDSYGFY